jgi:hypothetical protein
MYRYILTLKPQHELLITACSQILLLGYCFIMVQGQQLCNGWFYEQIHIFCGCTLIPELPTIYTLPHVQVLFYSLPLVLDGYKNQSEGEEDGKKVVEGGGEDEIVEQAVDFLQALLNLMTNLQLHLQV